MLTSFGKQSGLPQKAELSYLDGDYRVIKPGAFVSCAVSGQPILLEDLKYWSVERQEAYVNAEAVMQRFGQNRP